MPKTLLQNRINGSTSSLTLPTDAAGAQAFAEAFLDGEYAIYDLKATLGNSVVAVAPTKINVSFWNELNPNNKSYMNVVIPAAKTENDLFTALIGLTLNGITITHAKAETQRVLEKF